MDLNKHFFIFLIFSLTALQSQDSYIRSMLPIRDGITYNPDNGRPFSDLTTEFFDNGQIMLKGRYSAGFANGYWSYYYPNGQMKARGRYYKAHDYKLDGIIEDGRVGKWIYWFNNGAKKMMGIYKNSKMDGHWVFWYQNGYKHSEGRYRSGKLYGRWQAWYANGNIQEMGD